MPIHPEEKVAGILAPVFALRHTQDLGIGDTQAVRESIDFCAEHGIGVLQILPINETGGDHSPYNAISSVALEPVLLALTPELVPGLTPEILDEYTDSMLLTTLRSGPVLYEEVKPLKARILAAAFVEFEDSHLEHATPEAVEFS
ncbi:MAG TPA: 4-alpha-glucanotransferase, partial [Candidatus Methylacidiphilales bacterium]|nr:4-alpha-glucanotransferase [Candidatus Methylacidiphilales bacterium]